MSMCCVKDPKSKVANLTTKYFPRQNGDLTMSYDVLQAYDNNYLAQVTINNNNPLGRLDHWNLTWEWMRGEFISSMRGAYTRKKDITECIYGAAAAYYKDLDFSKVMTCEKRPIISDLPPDREKDKEIGNLPYCCRNGSLLPTVMNETKSVSIFQLQVNKLPPDLNRTGLYPPERWKIEGVLNPQYKCGSIKRVDETEFPDPSGLQATTLAVASWQVICNITRPKKGQSRCCVSFSAYYNDSVVPCNTCACGCENNSKKCNADAQILLPPEAILLPFANRLDKAVAWAQIKHRRVPTPLPCPDGCGVSVNWHVASNYRKGWSARVTLFNWREIEFVDWFVAVQLNKTGSGFERAYSFNGTLIEDLNDTIFLTGLPGLNYLIGETNGTNPVRDPRVPGKQQSVLTFSKKHVREITVADVDVFPTRLFFNGEECALPMQIPKADASCCTVDFRYDNTTAYITYRGTPATEAPIEKDTIPARGKHDISTEVVVDVDNLVSNPYYAADYATGCLNFTSLTTFHGKAKVLRFLKLKATIHSACDISVYVQYQNSSAVCKSKVKY
ncbi:hypothetical protein DH2020_017312 [Rehmannia glutinosa]|uniref:COBRA C-terminal domain-containing protein n=1 Tax=Rehmannia glutinosa TaxID=99300 RepID=A0ABR0WTW2_REHGL